MDRQIDALHRLLDASAGSRPLYCGSSITARRTKWFERQRANGLMRIDPDASLKLGRAASASRSKWLGTVSWYPALHRIELDREQAGVEIMAAVEIGHRAHSLQGQAGST